MLKAFLVFMLIALFGFTGNATAQTSINGKILAYTVNGSGHVTQFVVKTLTDPAETKTILIPEPNEALSKIIIDCHTGQSNVIVTYTGSGSPVTFESMTVF